MLNGFIFPFLILETVTLHNAEIFFLISLSLKKLI